jgi:hypothetical protein
VNRIFAPVLIISLLGTSSGCGDVFVGGAINTGSTIIGSVNFVQIGNVIDGMGGTVQVTFVTFMQNGFSSTVGFCQDQTGLFPLNQIVRVNFNPGRTCATIIVVVIVT